MNPLISSSLIHHQDTLKTGSIIKLYIMLSTNTDPYVKHICNCIFCCISKPQEQEHILSQSRAKSECEQARARQSERAEF